MSSLTFISSESPDFDSLRAYYLNGIYFDGKTEDYFKYDCCGLLRGMLTYGIHDCTIHDYPNSCRAYIWDYKHGHFFWRGLIVDTTDAPAIEKAEAAYRERRQFL